MCLGSFAIYLQGKVEAETSVGAETKFEGPANLDSDESCTVYEVSFIYFLRKLFNFRAIQVYFNLMTYQVLNMFLLH